ncbi:MAG: GAF domain-containing protein, partial [Geobacteraceae bacterium]|nr:GAF domain-containing protein [Geobacteraceae bacterium]
TTLAVLISAMTTGGLYLYLRNQVLRAFEKRLQNIVSIAALAQDGNAHAGLTLPDDSYTTEYFRLNDINQAIVDSEPEIIFIYTMRKNENGEIYFVLDAGRAVTSDQAYVPSYAGVIYERPSDLLASNFDTLDQAIVEEAIYEDEFSTQFGGYLSAYAPIYTSAGIQEAIIGVDISAEAVQTARREAALVTLASFFLSVPIILGITYFAGTRLVRPLIELTLGAQKIAGGELSHRINIHTNDEVEELAINFNKMSIELERLFGGFEERIRERTEELKKAGEHAESRSMQFAAIAKIGQEIATLDNIELLLPRVAVLMSEQLGFYHVGIFINDNENRYAVLKAANSDGGHRMINRGHRLEIGQVGIVGNVANTGNPRIALDTGTDAVFFNNPDLPDTRSEMALPLKISSRMIGVLDIQSTVPDAFKQEDIQIVTVLADQISIAIENTRLFQETRLALEEARQTYRQFVRQEWQQFSTEQPLLGYKFSASGLALLEANVDFPEIREALSTGAIQVSIDKSGMAKMAVPITLHGETIGIVNIRADQKQAWSHDEIDIVQAAAERIALALENARLIADSQKRAAKERTIGEITSKIGGSIDIDTIISTAVEQMGNILPDADITIQFEKGDRK